MRAADPFGRPALQTGNHGRFSHRFSTKPLDAETGHTIMEILKSVAVEGDRAVIIVTHDVRVLEFGDRIARMEDGHIIAVDRRGDATEATTAPLTGGGTH